MRLKTILIIIPFLFSLSLNSTAINIPNTTSILISYESGCGYKEDKNGSLVSPLIGEYETSNFPEFFYTKASDETCPDTDNYMVSVAYLILFEYM